jgi:predicted O-linked N-acetylglucosamine transferase (SPINDLY family)
MTMTKDILSPALIRSMVGSLSVPDLIRTVETFRQSGQVASVERAYAAWIDVNAADPLLYAVLFNYSVTLADAGRLDEARACLERAIALNPDFMPLYINLGRVYERQGQVGLAVVQWSAALARMTAVNSTAVVHKVTALNQSARTLEALNQDEAAENMLRESLELDRLQREVVQHLVALRQRQCKWPVLQPSERVDEELLFTGMSPLSAAAFTDDPMLQLALAHHYNKMDVGSPAEPVFSWPRAEQSDGPLRIGYLSSDLREHAVGYLMTEVFGLHDRSRVEVFAYYCGPHSQDGLHEHFRTTADHWISITDLDDEAARQRMQEDGIQILVDLNGYTREARLKLVAMRPAPVIVNWLGFPGTMASPYHHYLIADDWIIPADHELYYSEQVLRLPCYQPSNRNRVVAPVRPDRNRAGLPEDGVVFCCFNGSHKIHRFTFERWMSILARVPGSVLWLLSSTDETNDRLRRYAEQLGVAGERIVFADKLANPAHLARYELADLFLDTSPYGAHTTASDALWVGVPVLTLSGRSFASRVCGSLLRAAGLEELVCLSAGEFVDRAVELGNNPDQIQELRQRLNGSRATCTLFDLPLLVRELEGLFERMWADYRQGRLPRPDLTNLDAYLEAAVNVRHEDVDVQTIADYRGWWTGLLARRHLVRPLNADGRLATKAMIEG